MPDYWIENFRLANWVMIQRQMYRMRKLSPDRVHRLEVIGFIWRRQDNAWNGMYHWLVSYLKAQGESAVPLELKGDPQLGSWVVKQRYRRKRGLLKEKRIRKLDVVGIRW